MLYFGDRAQDRAVAGVVGGEHEVPGPEPDVEILEVAGGRVDGPLRIASSVDPVADLEAVGAGGAGHELPDPARAHPRARAVVEAAFDHGHVEEISRQSLADEHRLEQVAVAARPAQPVRHHGVALGIVLEVVEVAEHLGVPAHRQIRQLQSAQPLRIGRLGRLGAFRRRRRAKLGRDVAGATPATRKRRAAEAPPRRCRRARSPGRGNASSSKRRISRSSGLSLAPTSSIGTPRTARRSDRLSSPGARAGAASVFAGGFACASPAAADAGAAPNSSAEPESRPSAA